MMTLKTIDISYAPKVQLQQLAYFVAVADTRHFTRAADQMGVAQPSLSQQVRTLGLPATAVKESRGGAQQQHQPG